MPAVLEPEVEEVEQEWYNPGQSIRAAHQSAARVRFAIGARGSGKTSFFSLEAVLHGWSEPGAKIMAVRKTEVSQADTTIETMRRTFAALGDLYVDTGVSLFKSWNDGRTVRIPSQKAVEEWNRVAIKMRNKSETLQWLDTEGNRLCSFIEMRGLSNAQIAENKLRGFECSMMGLIEADLLTLADFAMAIPCIRWRGADGNFIESGGIIVESNPPGTKHWIAVLEEEWRRGEHPDYEFWHIKTQENAHNLPPGYVENLKEAYRGNPAMYKRMVMGEFADAFGGIAVMFAFKPDAHVGKNLPWPKGAWLIRSADVGTHNSTIFSAYWRERDHEYWHVLKEIYLEGSDTERQARAIIAVTKEEFPFWNDRTICSGVLDFVDPAAANSNYSTSKTASSVAIFNTYEIYPGTNLWQRGIQMGLAICNRLLELRDGEGRYCFRIDEEGAPILTIALSGGYRYPSPGESGYGGDVPLKGLSHQDFDYSHSADSWRYGVLNAMQLGRAEHEKNNPNATFRSKNPNPDRMWY